MNASPQSAPRPFRYLFGPVHSRRLGRSLGIDLVLPKTCTESCLFCQVGQTDKLTIDRREFVPFDDVMGEFCAWLQNGGTTDVVTLSGSGEPTLHSRFGDVLAGVRQISDFKTVLLSNGTLFWLPEVRDAAVKAHVVKASLSAWDQASFTLINRPHPDLVFDQVFRGICDLRDAFDGELWLEVMVLAGLNDDSDAIQRIAQLAEKVRPDTIHLNTAVRPPAESCARPVSAEALAGLCAVFGPRASVIANPPATTGPGSDLDAESSTNAVLNVLKRRGSRVEDLAQGLSLSPKAVTLAIHVLVQRGLIRTERQNGETYYTGV